MRHHKTNKVSPTWLPLACVIALAASAWGWAASTHAPEEGAAQSNKLRTKALLPALDEPTVPTPEEEMETFQLAEGYSINLFADESLGVINPIQMTWDPQGRLWVCCSPSYPQAHPGEIPNDYILILEDTDGDGVADRSTKFVEGLYMPTGFELGDGGVYVSSAPDLWHMRDTDGDDQADERILMFTGFGTEDSHHAISTFQWGPGGRLYFQEGTFFHSQVETPYGRVSLIYGGMYELEPRSRNLTVFNNIRVSNPWGHLIDRWGEQVLVDNLRIIFSASLSGSGRSKISQRPIGRTAASKTCGGAFVSGRHLPDDMQNEFILPSYLKHRIIRYHLEENGSGYTSRSGEELLQSSSSYFRPVDLKMGPEGAIYVVDWFNPLIGHTQHDARDPRRDHGHGRIWRITHDDRPLVERPNLVGASLPDLLDHLKAPEDWTRHQVKRLLYEREAEEVEPALHAWVDSLDPNDPEIAHHLLEALWAHQVIGRPNEELLRRLLVAEPYQARVGALRVMRYWVDQIDDRLDLLATAIEDSQPRVRLEALLTLGFAPDAEAVVIAARVLDHPMDRFLEEALDNALEGLQPYYQAAYHAGELEFDKESHRLRTMLRIDNSLAIQPLISAIEEGSLDYETAVELLKPIAETASSSQIDDVWAAFTDVPQQERLDPDVVLCVLKSIEEASVVRGLLPSDVERFQERVVDFHSHSDLRVRLAAARLHIFWDVKFPEEAIECCLDWMRDDAVPLADRAEMAVFFGGVPRNDSTTVAEALLGEETSMAEKYLGALVYASAGNEASLQRVVDLLCTDPDGADPRYLIESFIRKRGGAQALGEALGARELHPETAALALQYLNEVGEQEASLVAALSPRSDAAPLSEQLLAVDVAELAESISAQGNAENGRQVFLRESLTCVKCHTVNAEEPLIGPDLGVVGRSPAEYLIESLLAPSAVIKEQFVNMAVYTKEGQVISGILRYQDDEKTTLFSSVDNAEITIMASDIDEIVPLQSLMPAGLVDQLSRQEFLDLMQYLIDCK